MNSQGMIFTIGNTSEPMIYSLRNKWDEERPPYILFISDQINERSVHERIIPNVSYVPQYQLLRLSDPFNIQKCYEEIRKRSKEWIEQLDLDPGKVCVDFTGGTKAMAGALILAAVELNLNTFEYVSGDERDPETGRVTSGQYVVALPSPLSTYAVRELERADWLLENSHADAAAEILESAIHKCGDELKARIETYAGISDCLARADRFDFGKGNRPLSRDFSAYLIRLELFDYAAYEKMRVFENHWQTVRDQTKESGKTPGTETLLELLANAERRARQARFDAAAARLYRVVELHAQILLREAFGAELGQPRLEDFPERIREDAQNLLGVPPDHGKYKVSLQDSYCLLNFSDNSQISSQSYIGYDLRDHLAKRNNSILAHGARPVSQDDYEKFWDATLSALGIKDSDIPRWPKINLTLN